MPTLPFCSWGGTAPLLKLVNLIVFISLSLLYVFTTFLLHQLPWRKFCMSLNVDTYEIWPRSQGINQINTLHWGKKFFFPDSSHNSHPIIPVPWINFTHLLQKALSTQVWVGRLATAIALCELTGFTKSHCSQDLHRYYCPPGGTFFLLSWILWFQGEPFRHKEMGTGQ